MTKRRCSIKTHSIYAVTASVKNFMGVVTRKLNTDSHNGVGRGAMGSIFAEVRPPDLTILDAVWILARPGEGPAASYDRASLRNQLVASRDPVALDMWAVRNILVPQIRQNGYADGDWQTTQNPDNPDGVFRGYLDRSMSEMLLGGLDATNDTRSVVLHTWTGDADFDGDLDLQDAADLGVCTSGPQLLAHPACDVFDFDADDRTDLLDIAAFQNLFTGRLRG